ncbi:RNA polymerase II-associated protein 3 [Tenebrio molitor]|uniref:RNA polymerase II-associated protein 3 n=1 Tax=Tenebrio molitor TaxID=7067 RepID=UPI0036249E15
MNPILLQKQLRENASDLNDFYKDLKMWGEDMKKKEESRQQPTDSNLLDKKTEVAVNKKRKSDRKPLLIEKSRCKSGLTDYTAWEKFDAEAECEKVDDENADSDLTDEYDETLKDEAYVEKEKGNKFVKSKMWDDAIDCYTKAIDVYSYDPIFYANRALCFLKKENYIKAESDCTMSITLDKTYVKAYQRRAAAREALNKWEDADSDLVRVLELEPKNKESKVNLENLRKKFVTAQRVEDNSQQRPVSKFTASRHRKKGTAPTLYNNNESASTVFSNGKQAKECITEATNNYLHSETDNIILVKAVSKPVHLQSKKPLMQIKIQELEECARNLSSNEEAAFSHKTNMFKTTLKTDDLTVVEKYPGPCEMIKENKNNMNNVKMNEGLIELKTPKNSVQFYSQWQHLKMINDKYIFLKSIKPETLPQIFKESLESGIFSEILEVLAKCFTSKNDNVFNFLMFFTNIRRFSTLTMFMSDNDKNHLWKLFDYVRERHERPKEEIDLLFKKYEL